MQQRTLIIIGVSSLLLIGISLYLIFRKNKSKNNSIHLTKTFIPKKTILNLFLKSKDGDYLILQDKQPLKTSKNQADATPFHVEVDTWQNKPFYELLTHDTNLYIKYISNQVQYMTKGDYNYQAIIIYSLDKPTYINVAGSNFYLNDNPLEFSDRTSDDQGLIWNVVS